MNSFLDFFWFMLWFFLWVIWIWLLIKVFADVFRSDSNGWAKAGWILFVIILPFLGVLIYLIVHGGDMAQRDVQAMQDMEAAQKAYIQNVAGSGGTADELQKLAQLRDNGVISNEEFEAQKAKLLS